MIDWASRPASARRSATICAFWRGAIRARPGQVTPVSASWRASGCSATRRSVVSTRSSEAAPKRRSSDAAAFNSWLSGRLRWLLWQLEEHHQVEDHHYFPLFRRAEPRLVAGFELLERDHVALHAGIGGIIGRANAVLAHEAPGRAAFRADLARFRDAQVDLGRELIRHLADEEDLVIPLLLERGEQFLLGGA